MSTAILSVEIRIVTTLFYRAFGKSCNNKQCNVTQNNLHSYHAPSFSGDLTTAAVAHLASTIPPKQLFRTANFVSYNKVSLASFFNVASGQCTARP